MSSTRPTPPAKPPANATRKALLAFHAELKQYHEKLQQWDAQLQNETARYMNEVAAFNKELAAQGLDRDDFVDDECYCDEGTCNIHPDQDSECECTGWDASNGCECDTCEKWRVDNDCPLEPEPTIGDEVQFLEKLFELKDKRRKPAQRH